MDVQAEYEKVKSLLDNAEGWNGIDKQTRNAIQERFQLLFTFVSEQQKESKRMQDIIEQVQKMPRTNTQIDLSVLKEVIDEQVATIKEQLEGKVQPALSKYEAMEKLGGVSSFVLHLYDKIEDEKQRDEVWDLKKEADLTFQRLMGF